MIFGKNKNVGLKESFKDTFRQIVGRTAELFNRRHDLYNYRAMYGHRMGTLQRIANFSAFNGHTSYKHGRLITERDRTLNIEIFSTMF